MKKNGNYKIIGTLAHQGKPKKSIDFTRTVRARNIVDVWCIYQRQLKGVKRLGLTEVRRIA